MLKPDSLDYAINGTLDETIVKLSATLTVGLGVSNPNFLPYVETFRNLVQERRIRVKEGLYTLPPGDESLDAEELYLFKKQSGGKSE